MYVVTALAVFLILSALVIASQLGISAESNCAPPDGAAWVVNTTVVCESRDVNVTSITISDTSEDVVTTFLASEYSVADASGNSSTLDMSTVPDLIKDESAFTKDWDSDSANGFFMEMNETEHQLHIFINKSPNNYTAADKVYFIEIDDNVTNSYTVSGLTGDFIIGLIDGDGPGPGDSTEWVTCYNESGATLENNATTNSTSNGTNWQCHCGMETYYNVTWNQSNHTIEVLVDVAGPWINKKVQAVDGSFGSTYTTFRNDTNWRTDVGSLTLTGVTLNMSGNILVDTNGTLNIGGNSWVDFQNNNDGELSNLTANAGSTLTIDNSTLTGNVSDTWWYAHIYTADYNITGNTLNDTQLRMYNGSNGFVYNNLPNNCDDDVGLDTCFYVRCDTIIECNGLNISSNGNASDRFTVDGAEGIIIEKHGIQQPTISGCVGCTFNQNNITGVFILTNATSNFIENNTFVNNQFSNAVEAIRDTDSSPNDFIYYNSYGKIFWDDYVNYSVDDVVLNYSDAEGSKIILAENLIDLVDDDHNLSLFNTSATLTFYGLTWGTATLLKNGARCDGTTDCNITYDIDAGILVANVSGFSNYTTNGTAKPNVTLVSPVAGYANGSATSVNVTFICNATDDVALANISLYITNTTNGSFSFNQTSGVTDTTNSTNWSMMLGLGNYTWNCLAYDANSTYDWADNRTLAINYSVPVVAPSSSTSSSSSSSSSSSGGTAWGVCGDTLCNDGETCTCDATENNHGGACYNDCGECSNCDELAAEAEAEARAIEEAEAERVAKESAAEEAEGDQLPLAGQAYGESQTRKSYRNLLIILAVLLAVILIVVIIVLSLRMHK